MNTKPVIAIFDVGKTNKKFFLFDEYYQIVYEKTQQFTETTDEDGYSCEDVNLLTQWVKNSLKEVLSLMKYELKAVNFSAYGASFVHVNKEGNAVMPLYNYLKPFPNDLLKKFYTDYGGELSFSITTASPVLGNLNSGMQLYRLKYERPKVYEKVWCSLHLPQYLSYLITRHLYSDITSIGCHTNLWNFSKSNYHNWILKEAIAHKLAPIYSSDKVVDVVFLGKHFKSGIGLHDSSAALIPYLASFHEPFVLISTGTWCISLNPFNNKPLTEDELKNDCLCYLSYTGNPVKASRLFAGNEHEVEVNKLATHYNKPAIYYATVTYDISIVEELQTTDKEEVADIKFADRDLGNYKNYETAYHRLIMDIIRQQTVATKFIIQDDSVKRIFVDGGFSKNPIFMHLLAKAFPRMEVYAASVSQSTAVGAALAIHQSWNSKPYPSNIINLKFYANTALPYNRVNTKNRR